MRRAFSLVELSIVLVILGLLVGGILAGQSLLHAAELRSIAADMNRYETALYAFKDKYFALPGDMTNATYVWGDQATGTNACASAATADGTPGTCNGNGDGYIQGGGSFEAWRAWQHLAFAGLVEGNYAGTQSNWGANAMPGVDFPASKISNSGYMFMQLDQTNSEFAYTDLTFKRNFLVFGSAGSTWPAVAALLPIDAYNIDTKLDDGMPGKGKVFGGRPNGGCTTGNTSSAAYNIAGTSITCILSKQML